MQDTAGNSVAILVDRRTGSEFNVSRYSTSLGRDLGCDLVINLDKTISRQHANIVYVDGKFYLQDLQSKNGTRLNGKKVQDRLELRSGDEITLGLTQLIFVLLPSHFLTPVSEKNRTETLVGTGKNLPALSY